MSHPVRVQLSRRKGWRMPPNTVVVSRLSKLGNPFRVVPWGKRWGVLRAFELGTTGKHVLGFGAGYIHDTRAEANAHAVALLREAIDDGRFVPDLNALRGMNVACWCGLDEPCHGDLYIELANQPSNRAV